MTNTALFSTRHAPLISLLLLLLILCTPGCRERSAPGEPWEVHDPLREKIEGLRTKLDGPLRQAAEAQGGASAMKALLEREAKRPWRQRVSGGIKYADLFLTLYKKRAWHKVAITSGGLSEAGAQALLRVEAYQTHALSEPMTYHLKHIKEALAIHAARTPVPWTPVVLDGQQVNTLVSWAKAKGLGGQDAQALEHAVLQAVLSDAPGASPIPGLTRQLAAYAEATKGQAGELASLELHIMDGVLRYARDMRLFNLRRYGWSQLKAGGGSKAIIYKRLGTFFTALSQATDQAQVVSALDALNPPHPQYDKMRAFRDHYAAIVAAGGWKPVSPVPLRQGVKGEGVRRLRERLEVEGWLGEPVAGAGASRGRKNGEPILAAALPQAGGVGAGGANDVLDARLLDAVRLYYRTHQLEWGETPERIFWKSVNVPATERLAQVELNLERWRASRYEGEERYVLVNLPQFQAMMVRQGEVVRVMNLVIGKNNRECDEETGRWRYPNATPSLASKLEYFILNPSWYVPDRIVEEEIKPQAQKDEAWLERKGYEVIKKDKKTEKWVVRQLPGDENALGVAKFIFPNRHNTYMHDTPRKQYFKESIRAYSHGCMRVEDPVGLATYLMESDDQDPAQIELDVLLKEGRSKMIKLKQPWPLFVEYHTVMADDQGWPQFFIDIYRRDERDLGPTPGTYGPCYAPKGADNASGPSDDVGP